MGQDKLRGWLNLPVGPWPPDHYALIGLTRGEGTAEQIEVRVLERLERLRRYQLPHPDEATEGMNLLARALDTLTDPEARRAYDRSLGIHTVPISEPPPLPQDDLFHSLFPDVSLRPVESPGLVPFDEPLLPEAILLPDVEDEPDVDDDPEFIEGSAAELPDVSVLPATPAMARLEERPAPRLQRPQSPKRELYAELARVRRVLRVWERARPYLTDTDRTFSRRTDALALMGCLAELRPLLPTVTDLVGGPHRPGGIVAALARQRLMFETLRSLLPTQRDALAKDFRSAHYRLAGYYDDLRDEVRRKNKKDWTRTTLKPFLNYLIDRPEWVLLPFALTALAVAAVRSM
jgi:hypothetical protein